MMEHTFEQSPRRVARIAGVFYLLTIITAMFGIVGDRLVVDGDAAATAANILAHERTIRVAFVGGLLAGACYIVVTALFYDLFRPVNKNLSLLAAFFSLVGVAVGAVSSLLRFAPLVSLSGEKYLSALQTGQLQAVALMCLNLTVPATNIAILFFGFFCLLIGCLVLKSIFLLRFLGVLMVMAGLGWLTSSFATFLSPHLADTLSPYILAPGALGELSLTVWLIVMGVKDRRWKERASALAG